MQVHTGDEQCLPEGDGDFRVLHVSAGLTLPVTIEVFGTPVFPCPLVIATGLGGNIFISTVYYLQKLNVILEVRKSRVSHGNVEMFNTQSNASDITMFPLANNFKVSLLRKKVPVFFFSSQTIRLYTYLY